MWSISQMTKILELLGRPLKHDTRRRVFDRAEVLMRGVEFLDQTQSEHIRSVRSRGWTTSHLAVVCELVAFYQVVVGPLASAARRSGASGLGSSTVIQYGSEMRFDREYARDAHAMEVDFHRLAERAGVQRWWLVANGADELVYRIAQHGGEE